MKNFIYIGSITCLYLMTSCGDPSRPAAEEAAELAEGRIIEHIGEPDTSIDLSAGGGTAVRTYEADTVISWDKDEFGHRLK